MKAAKGVCIVLVFVLALISTAFSQEAAQCRADLKMWVPVFKAIYDAPECQGDGTVACAFAAPVKNLTSGQLTTIAAEMDCCAKLDIEGDRYLYQRVATRAENILVMRTAYFLKESNQSAAFAEWESKRIH